MPVRVAMAFGECVGMPVSRLRALEDEVGGSASSTAFSGSEETVFDVWNGKEGEGESCSSGAVTKLAAGVMRPC